MPWKRPGKKQPDRQSAIASKLADETTSFFILVLAISCLKLEVARLGAAYK